MLSQLPGRIMPDRLPAHFGRQQERDDENGSAVGVPAEYPPAHAIARKAVDDRSVLIDRGAPLVDDRISLVDHEPAIPALENRAREVGGSYEYGERKQGHPLGAPYPAAHQSAKCRTSIPSSERT